MRITILLAASVAALLFASAPVSSQGQPAGGAYTVDRYLDFQMASDARVSPDGRQVVYTRNAVDRFADRWRSEIWIMDADGSRHRFFANGSAPVWSPDGDRIAYLAEGEPNGAQIWVRRLDAEGATQITRVERSPENIGWSPDGHRLGFTAFVPKRSEWSIAMPAAPEGAEWTPAPRHVDRLHYRQERRGFTEPGNTHLFLVSADGGPARQLTSGDWNVGFRFDGLAGGVAWDWSPDGSTIVVEGLREDDWDLRYRDSNLYAVTVETGEVRRLTTEPGTWRQPTISPDGRSIAFSGTPAGDYSYRAAAVYLMGMDGTGKRAVTAELDRDPIDPRWAPDGREVFFSADDQGSRHIYAVSTRGAIRQVTEGMQLVTLGSIGRAGVGFGVHTDPHRPAEVVRVDLRRGSIQHLTRLNDEALRGVRLGEVEEIWYESADGTPVQGWLVKPPAFELGGQHPLIMEIHGGPHAMYNVGFTPMFQNFAAHGYLVLYTNPRGSTGYGSDFGNAIERAYPSVDHDDLMAGIDAVVDRGYVDTDRIFVGGCSGGGVLSSWAIAHTDRFAAASVRCPVTNWLSMAGTSDVPLFTYNFFERPFWEDPEPWLHQSPLMHVGRVNTPTLIMTGELDLRTPMAQSEEYYMALQMRGVPSELLRFEGEFHGTGSRPSNWMRTQLYMMDWYERWGNERAAGSAGR